MNLKFYSWNVNGFRSVITKGFWDWFAQADADVVFLQEVKADPTQVLDAERQVSGYQCIWNAAARKGYSGTACYTRMEPQAVRLDLPDPRFRDEGRLIELEFPWFTLFGVYFPNGQMSPERLQYKLDYYDAFLAYVEEVRAKKPVIVCGDFNTAHQEIDLKNPKQNENRSGFLPVERAWIDRFIAHGYVDTFRALHPDARDAYSWWSFRFGARRRNAGWRIDYFFVSEELMPMVRRAWIEPEVMGSDHCPVGLEVEVS
ncbi:exodeoxyribonuclease III [Thermodesulfomicrobium sp. WS]|uniref:exodeoxyribonuclease III n=1 Tax=Thermodesulfomicrobium sp. WS TaxID=3004129 RepID=UPI00248FD45B|nr:exodeoxyribonuclease III [Thermodesulfomicrobium sp. WS]BDV00952.1 exodeoxyribonuclease III [Thermodesulfomicrobium sp. WS]